MMGSSMAGSVVGSVVGHGISNMMFGGSSNPSPQQVQQQYEQQGGQGPCAYEMDSFLRCVQENNNDSSACPSFLEQLQYCKQTQQPQQ